MLRKNVRYAEVACADGHPVPPRHVAPVYVPAEHRLQVPKAQPGPVALVAARPVQQVTCHALLHIAGTGGHANEMAKPLLCRIGWHKWHKRVNDGQSYLTCGRCGKYADNDRPTTPFGAGGGG